MRPINSNWDESRWHDAIQDDDIYLAGAQAGFTRAEIDQWRTLNPMNQRGGPKGNVTRVFMRNVLPGYLEYREHVKQNNERPVSAAMWRRTPEFKRAQMLHGIPLDRYNAMSEDEQSRYFVPKGEVHAIPYDAMRSSWFPREGNILYTTTEPAKWAKSLARGGQHEQVGFSSIRPVRGPMRAGPGSLAPDLYTPMRAAFILEGEVSGSGQGLISNQLGDVEYRTPTRVYSPTELNVSPIGTKWGTGEKTQWATTQAGTPVAGHSSRWWAHELVNVERRQIPETAREHAGEWEYTAVFRAFRPIQESTTKVGYGATKSQGDPQDLSGWHIAGETTSAGLQWISSLKDPAGAAHVFFMEAWRKADPEKQQRLATQMGYRSPEDLPSNYADLGQAAINWLRREDVLSEYFKEVRHRETIHRTREDALRGSIVAGSQREVPGQPDLISVERRYHALVGDAALQIMQTYGANSPTLPYAEQQVLGEEAPRTMQRLARAGRRVQQSYRSLAVADLASQGGQVPSDVKSAAQFAPFFREMLSRAEDQVRAEGKLDASGSPDPSRVARVFSNLFAESASTKNVPDTHIQTANYPGGMSMSWGDEAKPFITPAARYTSYLSATGTFEGEEVSAYQLGLARLARAQASGDMKSVQEAIEGYDDPDGGHVRGLREIQHEMASSQEALRMATGIKPGNDQLLRGRVLRASNILAENEVWARGMGGKTGPGRAGYLMRSPSSREGMTQANVRILSDEEWAERGMDPKSEGLYAHNIATLAVAGDTDGDIGYLIRSGDLVVGKDKQLYDQQGNLVDSIGKIRAMATKATNRGAGDPGELADFSNPERARAKLLEKLQVKSLTRGQQQTEMGVWKKKWSQVGPVYNMYMRMKSLSKNDVAGRHAMNELGQIAYGKAQRPQWQPEFANALRVGMYGSFGTQPGAYGKFSSFDPQSGMVSTPSAILGLEGLRKYTQNAIYGFLTPSKDKVTGEPHPGLDPETTATLMAPDEGDLRARLKEVHSTYQADVADIKGKLMAKGIPEEEALVQARTLAAEKARPAENQLVSMSQSARAPLTRPLYGSVLSRSIENAQLDNVVPEVERWTHGLSGDEAKGLIDDYAKSKAYVKMFSRGLTPAAFAMWQQAAGENVFDVGGDKPGEANGPVAQARAAQAVIDQKRLGTKKAEREARRIARYGAAAPATVANAPTSVNTPTTNAPVADSPEAIAAFARRVANGEKMDSPEDVQFMANNASAINDTLRNIAASGSTGQHLKADGTPDMRFRENRGSASGGGRIPPPSVTPAAAPAEEPRTPGEDLLDAIVNGTAPEMQGMDRLSRTHGKIRGDYGKQANPSRNYNQTHPMRSSDEAELRRHLQTLWANRDLYPSGMMAADVDFESRDVQKQRNRIRSAVTGINKILSSTTIDKLGANAWGMDVLRTEAGTLADSAQFDLDYLHGEETKSIFRGRSAHGTRVDAATRDLAKQLLPQLQQGKGWDLPQTEMLRKNIQAGYGGSQVRTMFANAVLNRDAEGKERGTARLGDDFDEITKSAQHLRETFDRTTKSVDSLQKKFDDIIKIAGTRELTPEESLTVKRMGALSARLEKTAEALDDGGDDMALDQARRARSIGRKIDMIAQQQEEFDQPSRRGARGLAGNIFDELSIGGYAFRTRATWGMLTGYQRNAQEEYLSSEQSVMAAVMRMGATGGGGSVNQYVANMTRASTAREHFGRGVASVWTPAQVAFGNEGLGAAAAIGGPALGAGFAVGGLANMVGGLLGAGTAAGGALIGAAWPIGAAVAGGAAVALGAGYAQNESKNWYQSPEGTYSRNWRETVRRNELTSKASAGLTWLDIRQGKTVGIEEEVNRIMAAEEATWKSGYAAYDADKLRTFIEESTSGTVSAAEGAGAYAQLAQMAKVKAEDIYSSTNPRYDLREIFAKQIQPRLAAGLSSTEAVRWQNELLSAAGVPIGDRSAAFISQFNNVGTEEYGAIAQAVSTMAPLTNLRGVTPGQGDLAETGALLNKMGSIAKVQTLQVTAEQVSIATGRNAGSVLAQGLQRWGQLRPDEMSRNMLLEAGMGGFASIFGLFRGTTATSTMEGSLTGATPEEQAGYGAAGAMLSSTLQSLGATPQGALSRVVQFVQGGGTAQQAQGFQSFASAIGNLTGISIPKEVLDQPDMKKWTSPMGQKAMQILSSPMGLAFMKANAAGGTWQPGQEFGGYEMSLGLGGGAAGIIQEVGTEARTMRQQNMGRINADWGIQSAGMQLSLHNDFVALTKSLRGLEDATIKSNRGAQEQGWAFQRAGAEMSYRHAMQNLGHQEKVFQLQSGWQREDLIRQAERLATTQDWQRQNMSYQESMAGLSYAWSQEDLERNIRFASGRERQQLIRQRNRGQVAYSMEEGQRQRERGRFETQATWQTEDLQRQREHFEELTRLQQEYFNMQKSQLAESFALQMAQINAQEAHTREQWALEDQERELQRKYQDKQNEFQGAQLAHQLEMAKLAKEDFEAEIENWKKITAATKEWQDMTLGEFLYDGKLSTTFRGMIDDWVRYISTRGPGGSGDSGTAPPPTKNGSQEEGVPTTTSPSTTSSTTTPTTTRSYPKDPEGWDGSSAGMSSLPLMTRTTSSPISSGPVVNLRVFLGDQDITDLVSTRLTSSQTFERGLASMMRKQNNRGYN